MVKFEKLKLLTWLGAAAEVKVVGERWAREVTGVHVEYKTISIFQFDEYSILSLITKEYMPISLFLCPFLLPFLSSILLLRNLLRIS